MLDLGNDLGWTRGKQHSPDSSVQEVPNNPCLVQLESPDSSKEEEDLSLGETNMDIDDELRSNGIHITEDLFEPEANDNDDDVALNKQLCVDVDDEGHVLGVGSDLVLAFDPKEIDSSDVSRTESAASEYSQSSFSSKADELDDVSASASDDDAAAKIIRTFNNQADNPYFNYYLVAMVNHIGESVNSGHYKADVYW